MKKLLILLVLATTVLSCKKTDKEKLDIGLQAAIDDSSIQTYLSANKIIAQKDSSGVYYEIVKPGSGTVPTATSTVEVQYTGKFLDGTTFDTSIGKPNLVTSLSNVIEGWGIGVPYIKPGGRINLYIPSALAYGPAGRSSIPPNTVLIFTIDLVRVQ